MKFASRTLLVGLLLTSTQVFAAGSLHGTVQSGDSGKALIGAEIVFLGTNMGTVTGVDGGYMLNNIPSGSYDVQARFIGYEQMVQKILIPEGNGVNLDFQLTPSIIMSEDVVITTNRAVERETPVAFSNVGEDQITKKFTVQDIPLLFKDQPGVYVQTDGGNGMGDSKVFIRGFDEQRVQVMINGIPVNDPESKKVYWSNWGSLPSGSQSLQIQRGVGSSLYGSGAFGGSINVVTSESRSVRTFGLNTTYGMYNTLKLGVDYNSGLQGNQAFLLRANGMWGNAWRNSTYYSGYSYYGAWSLYLPGHRSLNLVLHGAPQEHAYSYNGVSARNYARYGDTYNGMVFVKRDDPDLRNQDQDGDGELLSNDYVSFENNHYHKPQFEVHYKQQLNDKSRFEMSGFASVGRGYGEWVNRGYALPRDDNGFISFSDLFTDDRYYQYRSYSLHQQVGLLGSYSTKLGEHDLVAGFETRYWDGRHIGEVLNTFGSDYAEYGIGGQYYNFAEGDDYYDYTTTKPQISTYVHGLWRLAGFDIMTDVQYSFRHYHVMEDIPGSNNRPVTGGEYTMTDVDGDTYSYDLLDDTWDYSFFNPKFGVNYNIGSHFNVFTNYSRTYNEPRVKYFYNYGQPNHDIDLEISDDIEFGLGSFFTFVNSKVNFYRINFDNKSLKITDPTMANQPGYDNRGNRYEVIGNSIYQGMELSNSLQLMDGLRWNFAVTMMNNQWGNDITDAGLYVLYKDDAVAGTDFTDTDGDGGLDPGETILTDLVSKYGNKYEPETPQTVFNTSFDYTYKSFYFNVLFSHYQDYYVLPSNSDVVLNAEADGTVLEEGNVLPAWYTIDLHFGYTMPLGPGSLNTSFHVNNLLNEDYYQNGSKYGFVKGPERNMQLSLAYRL